MAIAMSMEAQTPNYIPSETGWLVAIGRMHWTVAHLRITTVSGAVDHKPLQ